MIIIILIYKCTIFELSLKNRYKIWSLLTVERNYIISTFIFLVYIETRYPADIPLIVTDEEATECILIAETIYGMALEYTKL